MNLNFLKVQRLHSRLIYLCACVCVHVVHGYDAKCVRPNLRSIGHFLHIEYFVSILRTVAIALSGKLILTLYTFYIFIAARWFSFLIPCAHVVNKR